MLGATLVVSAAVVAIAIGISRAGGDRPGTVTGPPEGVAETRALYGGIPQRGTALGAPSAEVTLTEFADLQCPFCGEYGRDVLPELVRRYVRPGRVRMEFRALTFIGRDSERAARMALAAGAQGRLWQFVDLVYRNQGAENDGWVTDDYLRRIGTAAGLDVERAFAQRARVPVDVARREAERAGIGSTPSFLVQRAGRPAERFEPDELTVEELADELDRALAEP